MVAARQMNTTITKAASVILSIRGFLPHPAGVPCQPFPCPLHGRPPAPETPSLARASYGYSGTPPALIRG